LNELEDSLITETPDSLTTATAVPTAAYPSGMPATAGASIGTNGSSPNGAARDRIHRLAGMAHQAIDSLEQRLGSTTQGVMATQAKGGEQVRRYGDQLRERVNTQPMQTLGIALGTGFVLSKLFGRAPKEKVRVVRVPTPMPSRWDATHSVESRASGLMDAARAHIERLGDLGHSARDRVGAAAGLGIASTQQVGSTLARKTSDVTQQVRLGLERLFSRTQDTGSTALSRVQDYGSMARARVQEHPAAGAGVLLGVGALATTLLLQRRRAQPAAYVEVDGQGSGLAWRHRQSDLQSRTREMISDRPVASAAVVLGLGALAAAMLRRR
jgi:ElaB/YqjD/DUF883 family membrane-anchored ribosome-binding protein